MGQTVKSLVVAAVAGGVLAGCAAYHARALPDSPDTQTRLPAPKVALSSVHLPGLRPHPFDASHGLDMTDVAILAVLNDPALKSLRAAQHATAYQAFAAGLLPGPQVAYSRDRVTGNSAGLVAGRSVGLAYDLNALVTSAIQKNAAEATAQQANLNVLWAEWQTAQQASVLFLQIRHDRRQLALLQQLRQVMDRRYRNLKQALHDGDISYDTLGLEYTAIQDVDARVSTLRRDLSDARIGLNRILGLAPETKLDLVAGADGPIAPTDEQIATALKALPQRRPDLIALQYAYRSADEAVRRAVVEQFPAINLGINRANDTSNVHTTGLDISISFPFITGGPTYVHAAEAARDAVWQEYQQRLDQADSDVRTVVADLRLVDAQLGQLEQALPTTEGAMQNAHAAYLRGDLTVGSYYSLAISVLNSRLQASDLELERQQLQLALSVQLGLPRDDLEHLSLQGKSK